MEQVSVNANKALQDFRNYEHSHRQEIVELHYRKMREHQTVAYVRAMYAKYHSFNHAKMTIAEAFQALKGYVYSLSRTHALSLSFSRSHTQTPQVTWIQATPTAASPTSNTCFRSLSLSLSLSFPLSLPPSLSLFLSLPLPLPYWSLPDLEHMLQTAEAARNAGQPEWFQLTCLIRRLLTYADVC